MSTDNIDTLNARIKERVLRGEHFVRPDIVIERYINGLKLLNFYFKHVDRLKLIDNSENAILIAEIEKGQSVYQNNLLPKWITEHLTNIFLPEQKQEKAIREMNNAEEVRNAYLKQKRSKGEAE